MPSEPGIAFPDDDSFRALRNSLVHRPRADLDDLRDLISELTRAPSWRELGAAMDLLGDRAPGGAPVFLADFVAQLAASRSASAILDPFATSPTLIAALAEHLPQARSVALTASESVAGLGRSVAPNVDWRVGPPFETLSELEGSFDFVAGTPPLGIRNTGLPVRPRLGEYANSLMVDVAERLTPGGALAFLVADGFFFRSDAARTQDSLRALGLQVEAAISVEGGLRPQSEIPSSLVLVTPSNDLDELFVGRLDSVIDPATLIDNVAARKIGEFLQLGVLYPRGRYRGWRALLNEAELLIGLGNVRNLRTALLEEVALRFVRLPNEDVAPANSIYLPEFPRAAVLVEPPDKPRGYTRVDLDPERVNARWIATWFNEPLGRTARMAQASGGTIERVRPADLRRLTVVLPALDDQATAISIAQELQLIAREVADTRAGLWTGELTIENALGFLNRVRGTFSQAAGQLSPAPTVDTWIEELPFPLAVIGRMYRAVTPTREKIDHLQHFFEAYAIFLTTTLLSASRRDPQTYEATIAKIRGASDRQRSSVLDRADFGTWIMLGQTIAKRLRGRLNAGSANEFRATLFGGVPPGFVDTMTAKKLWDGLDAARVVRNERGHGGVEGDKWLRAKLARLEASLNDLRAAAPHSFAGVDLVRPGRAEQGDDDLFTFDRSERLMGSNMTFEERVVKSTAPMRSRGLYLVPASAVATSPLQLLPLVQLRKVPESEERAVYYYSRRLAPGEGDGFRFVSYHFEGRPEERLRDSDLAGLIDDLTPE